MLNDRHDPCRRCFADAGIPAIIFKVEIESQSLYKPRPWLIYRNR